MRVLIVDSVCPSPYSIETLEIGSLGGTEAYVIRLAQALAKKHYYINIIQRNRALPFKELSLPITYLPENTLVNDVRTVITLRDAGVYKKQKELYPQANHFLWMHDVVNGEYLNHLGMHLKGQNVNMVCVSNWHKKQIAYAVQDIGIKKLGIDVIYPPLAPYCIPTGIEYDPYKLVFFSSPHKGLAETLEIFAKLYLKDNRYRLYIANPGYYPSAEISHPGIIVLGTLTHRAVINHVRSSLCKFYPNTSFQETFGLVLAEANAVGTPVIAHPIGASSEVLEHPKQLLNCFDHELVINTVLKWTHGERLIVNKNKDCDIDIVTRKWMKLINS